MCVHVSLGIGYMAVITYDMPDAFVQTPIFPSNKGFLIDWKPHFDVLHQSFYMGLDFALVTSWWLEAGTTETYLLMLKQQHPSTFFYRLLRPLLIYRSMIVGFSRL